MPEISESALAFLKLFLVFGCILVLLRKHAPLWLTIFIGAALVALLTLMPLAECLALPLRTAIQPDFLLLELMLFGIMALSGIQGASGQSVRLVAALERFIRWPRIRLIVFPALVGLLPMPGGALFSCPMLDAAAKGMDLSNKRKTLINYWFRHIWEVAWPLYPGYVLLCTLMGMPLLSLLKYTFPLVILFFATGWFLYMRGLPAPESGADGGAGGGGAHDPKAIWEALYEILPVVVAILGAALAGLALDAFIPGAPSQWAFIISVFSATALAAWQGRGRMEKSLRRIALNKGVFRMLLLVYAVYLLKDTISASGLISQMSHVGGNLLIVYPMFIILPLICGMITGIMVGFVGACFPILLGIIAETPALHDQALPLVVLAMICGHAGQLLSPLHICLVVTCEYFKTGIATLWRDLIPATAGMLVYGSAWAFLLYLMGAGT